MCFFGVGGGLGHLILILPISLLFASKRLFISEKTFQKRNISCVVWSFGMGGIVCFIVLPGFDIEL